MTLTVTNLYSNLEKTVVELDEPELVNAIIRHIRVLVPSLDRVRTINLSVEFEDYNDGNQYKAIVTYRHEIPSGEDKAQIIPSTACDVTP